MVRKRDIIASTRLLASSVFSMSSARSDISSCCLPRRFLFSSFRRLIVRISSSTCVSSLLRSSSEVELGSFKFIRFNIERVIARVNVINSHDTILCQSGIPSGDGWNKSMPIFLSICTFKRKFIHDRKQSKL
jgi:hypothetical protein